MIADFERALVINKVLDASRRSRTLSGGAEERRLRCIGNTPQVLFLIHEGRQLTMTELHRCTGLEKGSLTFVVDQLIEKGLVKRTGDEKDRRKVYVSLTDFGQKETAIHSDEVSRFIQSKLDRLQPDDRRHFFRAIKTLLEISEKLEI